MADPEMRADTPEGAAPRPRSQLAALLVLGVVAVLTVGFAIGFFARLQLEDPGLPIPATDSVDVGFAKDMSVHHNQAIEMSVETVTRSADREVRSLAYDVLTTQQSQVGTLQGLLSLWDQPLLPTDGYMAWMTADAGHGDGHSGMQMSTTSAAAGPATSMPGMASQVDMSRLRQASGPELDVLFLQLLLRHHEGGTAMAQYAADHADVRVVAALARQMVTVQGVESATMRHMLAARGAAPLPIN